MSKSIYIQELNQRSLSELLGIPYKHIDLSIDGTEIEYVDPLEQVRLMHDAWRGQNHTEESKNKISAGLSGRSLSEEHKKNLSIARTGMMHSAESKRHMSEIKKGKLHPMYGKPNPTTAKMNTTYKSIKIKVLFLDGEEKTFDKISNLGLYLNKSKQLAVKLCSGDYPHLLAKYNIENIIKL